MTPSRWKMGLGERLQPFPSPEKVNSARRAGGLNRTDALMRTGNMGASVYDRIRRGEVKNPKTFSTGAGCLAVYPDAVATSMRYGNPQLRPVYGRPRGLKVKRTIWSRRTSERCRSRRWYYGTPTIAGGGLEPPTSNLSVASCAAVGVLMAGTAEPFDFKRLVVAVVMRLGGSCPTSPARLFVNVAVT